MNDTQQLFEFHFNGWACILHSCEQIRAPNATG